MTRLPTCDEQHRRSDFSPTGFRLVSLIEHWIHALVLRVAAQFDTPVCTLSCPRARDERDVVGGGAWIATREHRFELLEVLVARVARSIAHFIEPLPIARGREIGSRRGQTETFQIDEATNPFRTHARIHHRDVAAHAVPEEVDRRMG